MRSSGNSLAAWLVRLGMTASIAASVGCAAHSQSATGKSSPAPEVRLQARPGKDQVLLDVSVTNGSAVNLYVYTWRLYGGRPDYPILYYAGGRTLMVFQAIARHERLDEVQRDGLFRLLRPGETISYTLRIGREIIENPFTLPLMTPTPPPATSPGDAANREDVPTACDRILFVQGYFREDTLPSDLFIPAPDPAHRPPFPAAQVGGRMVTVGPSDCVPFRQLPPPIADHVLAERVRNGIPFNENCEAWDLEAFVTAEVPKLVTPIAVH